MSFNNEEALKKFKEIRSLHGDNATNVLFDPEVSVFIATQLAYYIEFVVKSPLGDDKEELEEFRKNFKPTLKMIFACDGCGRILADEEGIYWPSQNWRCKNCGTRVDICYHCNAEHMEKVCCSRQQDAFERPILSFDQYLEKIIQEKEVVYYVQCVIPKETKETETKSYYFHVYSMGKEILNEKLDFFETYY